LRLVARFRTPEGRIVRIAQGADSVLPGSASPSRRMTPPPEFLLPAGAAAEELEIARDPWWFLRALTQEAYQKHF
jgi:hypothetical protein